MSKAKPRPKLVPFDAAKYLTDDVAVAEYMNAVLESEDPDLLLLALGDVARARGMAQVAKDSGLEKGNRDKLIQSAQLRKSVTLSPQENKSVPFSLLPGLQRLCK